MDADPVNAKKFTASKMSIHGISRLTIGRARATDAKPIHPAATPDHRVCMGNRCQAAKTKATPHHGVCTGNRCQAARNTPPQVSIEKKTHHLQAQSTNSSAKSSHSLVFAFVCQFSHCFDSANRLKSSSQRRKLPGLGRSGLAPYDEEPLG